MPTTTIINDETGEVLETALAPVQAQDISNDFNASAAIFSTSKDTSVDAAIAAANAINSPDARISDFIGKTVIVKNFYAHYVQMADRDGVMRPTPRMILDTDKGTLQCVAITMHSALKNILGTLRQFGITEWPEKGIKVEIQQTSKGENRYYGLKLLKIMS